MGKFVSLFVLVFLFVGLGNVWGQELTEEEKQEIEEKYFGNQDYWRGSQFIKATKSTEAIPYYEKAAHFFEVEKKWKAYASVSSILTRAFRNIDSLDRALMTGETAIKKIMSQASEIQIESYVIHIELGGVLVKVGRSDEALEHYESAEALLIGSNKIKELANVYNSKLVPYYYAQNYEAAINSLEKAIEIYSNKNLCKDCEFSLGSAYVNLGSIYNIMGNKRKAIAISEKGLKLVISVSGNNSTDLINHYYNLGKLNMGFESERSNFYLKKLLYIIEKSETDNHFTLSILRPIGYYYIANNYVVLGNQKAAEDNYQKALALLKGDNYIEYIEVKVQVIIGLAETNLELEKTDVALEYLKQADTIVTNLYHPTDGSTADWDDLGQNMAVNLYTNYAQFYTIRKDYEQAIAYIKKAQSYLPEQTEHRRIDDHTWTNSLLANLFFEENQIDSALHYNQKAIIFGCTEFKDIDYTQYPKIDDFVHFNGAYEVFPRQAALLKVLAKKERNEGHQAFLLERALAAIDWVDEYHANNLKQTNFYYGNSSKEIISNSLPSYNAGISITYQCQQHKSIPNAIEKGFYYYQKRKAQQLLLTQLESRANKLNNINPAFKQLIEKEQNLTASISYYEEKIYAAQASNDTATISYYENELLFKAKTDYSVLVRAIETQFSEYHESKYKFQPETISSIQQILRGDEIIIEYAIIDSAYYTITIEKNQLPQFKKIQVNNNNQEQIKSYHTILTNSTMARPASREKFINLSHELYQQFLQPIESQLTDKKRIIIIGDGMTNYIPFETLLASNEVKPFKELDFLIKNHEISYHYSSTLFAKTKRKAQTENEGIFAFAPVYDDKNTPATAMRSDYIQMDSTLRAVTEDGHFSPLPESENEVNAIINLFDKANTNAINTLALRQEATEEALKTNLEKPYHFAHIAGHSFADLKNPKFSGIACFEEENQDSTALAEDGTLFTGEIYNISSQADLVTLSSCESGFGKLEKTEGLLGLNRAFIYAGTPNVVFSLWKVYDKVSADLMVDFYENVLEGEDYSASLRQAKLKLLEKEATAAPHFWSPFLLIGR